MLSSSEKSALRDMCSIAAKVDIPIMLVGAGARVLVFDRRYNVQGRSTTDWDWGIKVRNWQEFEALVTAMVEGSLPIFKKTQTLHRFEHLETQTLLDLVPFGPLADPNQWVEWPNERRMNVLGYEEALVLAEELVLAENWMIKVASVPALVVLKLIAWKDRGGKKDLEDVALMLQNYFEDDLYERLKGPLIKGDIDFEDMGAFELGQEIQNRFSREVTIAVDRILEEIIETADRLIPQLIPRMEDQWDERFEQILKRFEVLRQGVLR
jgi:predicted nucleotidyltransferase